MTPGPILALLFQGTSLTQSNPAAPPSGISLPFIVILAVIVAAGIVIAAVMIARTILGKPDDKSGAGKTAIP